jgi:dipeptidyl aminopeptidase/acylaminoacyl peptidase
MWVKGEGGYEIQCFVVKPHGFTAGKKYPLILNVHGGPQSQWSDAFRGDWQVYPAKGYVVAFANPTGSTGFGQDFTDAIASDYGGRVYRDLMKVTDALQALDYVDKDRTGVMGWSYGGYMSMWIEGHTDRFACNAAMMGIFDVPSWYGATEELWFPEHDMKGTPWTSDQYEKWSPSNHVKSFKTPALVISGELDYRCPYTQSLSYYTALQKMGVPSRLVILPNAGHWPAWHEMAFYYDVHLDFFHKWLGGEPAPYDVTEMARNLAFEKKKPEPVKPADKAAP